jgi:SAM-dependent methyltransferase
MTLSPAEKALTDVLERLQGHFFAQLEDRIIAPLAEDPACWGFVAMPVSDALEQLVAARNLLPGARSPKFLDCGSGLGFVAALAHGLGFSAEGIEICPRYLAVARQLFPQVTTHEGNVLDFAGYDRFDVIYYYGPFRDEALSRQFELKVEAEARPGAIILGNRKVTDEWKRSGQFRCLGGDGFMGVVLQKIGDQETI